MMVIDFDCSSRINTVSMQNKNRLIVMPMPTLIFPFPLYTIYLKLLHLTTSLS